MPFKLTLVTNISGFLVKKGITKYQNYFIVCFCSPGILVVYMNNKNFSILHNTQVTHNITQQLPVTIPASGKTKEFQVGRKLYAIH